MKITTSPQRHTNAASFRCFSSGGSFSGENAVALVESEMFVSFASSSSCAVGFDQELINEASIIIKV